ncbi:GDSL esterase/lipase At5g45920-like [Impatiens glandulifera]|uniref:GDSL esterase/lipase At5g45920-like n=1 Tax=Impatiens glandulifera TaxID=253017 RepID=UPI001FB0812C|nr:GDSL esterase/lipase At5g45920-like [Impatiens glandulifera]
MRPKIYLFGDSITEESFDIGDGGAILAHHFSRSVCRYCIKGYSGYNTRWVLRGFGEDFPSTDETKEDPVAVTIFFGANDATLPDRYCLLERSNESAGAYAKACISVAEECEAPVSDLWSRMQLFPGWDGLHLTRIGNMTVFEELIEKLRQVGVSIETQPIDLPLLTGD